uniref:tRNA-intron lyase n=1 Tax=Caenorhabditis japonica TaxID=281687 RepID=A0A8R1DV06_CAEJA
MELLDFDAKKSYKHAAQKATPLTLEKADLQQFLSPGREISAHLSGGLVQIFDIQVAEILHEISGIGQWLEDEREQQGCSVSKTCFRGGENGELDVEKAEKWAALSPVQSILTLSPEETLLLALDWQLITLKKAQTPIEKHEIWPKMQELHGKEKNLGKSYAVFRHLRKNGWIVRSGMTFGCDYLIYCLGARHFHASAAVLIADTISPVHMLTLTRILSHNKKALMCASVTSSSSSSIDDDDGNVTIENLEDVERVTVNIVTMKTYFMERDFPNFSSRQNELYEVPTKVD